MKKYIKEVFRVSEGTPYLLRTNLYLNFVVLFFVIVNAFILKSELLGNFGTAILNLVLISNVGYNFHCLVQTEKENKVFLEITEQKYKDIINDLNYSALKCQDSWATHLTMRD